MLNYYYGNGYSYGNGYCQGNGHIYGYGYGLKEYANICIIKEINKNDNK